MYEFVAGFIVGMAVGDAIGLPREGLSTRRAARLLGSAPLDHCLVFGRGMVSDDTEHLRMTALALLAEPNDCDRFARRLAWKLRWWLVGLPAGVGMATARSILRLWLGYSPRTSGVYSAGNGPAMRSGILGLCLFRDEDRLRDFVLSSTLITHRDPRAVTGAMIIALAAQAIARANGHPVDARSFLANCRAKLDLDQEWSSALNHVEQSLTAQESATQFAERMGFRKGVSGYIVHTVAAVIFCWLRWPGEFRRPVEEIILLGGDADTTGAILGGLAGASCGLSSIPPEWLNQLVEWPYSITWMTEKLSRELDSRWGDLGDLPGRTIASEGLIPLRPPIPRWIESPAQLARNVLFLFIVLGHGFRRLLPPY